VIALSVSVALYLLLVAPVLVAGFYAIRRREPGSIERAATDVQRFIDLREHARAELAETGSLDDFIAVKSEARKHLWRPGAGSRTREHRVAVRPGRSEAATIEGPNKRTRGVPHEDRRTAFPPLDRPASQ
jgi:hypothetical protein